MQSSSQQSGILSAYLEIVIETVITQQTLNRLKLSLFQYKQLTNYALFSRIKNTVVNSRP